MRAESTTKIQMKPITTQRNVCLLYDICENKQFNCLHSRLEFSRLTHRCFERVKSRKSRLDTEYRFWKQRARVNVTLCCEDCLCGDR